MEPPPIPIPPAGIVANSQDPVVQSTQQATQATQQAASQPQYDVDPNIWGSLVPYMDNSTNLETIAFQRWKRTYQFGRSSAKEHNNDVALSGLTISREKHCTITWDGVTALVPSIVVADHSSNGTFINGELIGKTRTALLRDGNELSFGTWEPQETEYGQKMAFRYIYRHAAVSRPTHGLYQHYDLQDELGKGTFATVMKALRRDDGKWYAVKIIDLNKLRKDWSHVMSETINVDEISKEISILQRLQHPNICELKDFFVDGTSLKWMPGGELLQYLLARYSPDKRMGEARAQYLTYQICKALAYVHSQGIAHRDLKPENVLLTADDPPIVKVADFGLAKAIDGESILKTVCGTPVYLAPEVITQGGQGYSLLVDSWSVGVIVFSMLTMSIPFPEDTRGNLEQLIANRAPQWDILYACGISAEGEDFLRGLLENDPKKRMNMADACVHRWLAGQVEHDMNIPNVPCPPHNPDPTLALLANPMSTATSSTMSDIQRAPPGPAYQSHPFRRIESYSSIPGLHHGRQQDPPLPSIPQGAQTPPTDDPEEDQPARATKRTASRAFSSSSSLDAVEVVPVDVSGSIPRMALPAGAAGVNESGMRRPTTGRAPPTKRVRVEAIGPSSSEDF